MKNTFRMIGIDPGYDRCGVACIESVGGKLTLLHSECIQTNSKYEFLTRMHIVVKRIQELTLQYHITHGAVEEVFFNTNQKTATKVAFICGAILFTLTDNTITTKQFTPLQVKVATTGYGRSDKKEVTLMIPRLITINKTIEKDDEWDAIAVALTGCAYIKYDSVDN